jgi:multiple sugar transport system substrate-binding protein
MTATDDLWYCPFAYGYSNYAREGYARRRLMFGDVVDKLRTTLGGTGLAISQRTRHRKIALEYARFVASPDWQRTLYTETGGQPGHREAWKAREPNRLTHGYFRGTLPTLDRAYLRPRYNGYLHFQDTAGPVVRRFLKRGGDPQGVIRKLNTIYQDSQKHAGIG